MVLGDGLVCNLLLQKNKATNLKSELLGAIYELGPNAEQEIKNI